MKLGWDSLTNLLTSGDLQKYIYSSNVREDNPELLQGKGTLCLNSHEESVDFNMWAQNMDVELKQKTNITHFKNIYKQMFMYTNAKINVEEI